MSVYCLVPVALLESVAVTVNMLLLSADEVPLMAPVADRVMPEGRTPVVIANL